MLVAGFVGYLSDFCCVIVCRLWLVASLLLLWFVGWYAELLVASCYAFGACWVWVLLDLLLFVGWVIDGFGVYVLVGDFAWAVMLGLIWCRCVAWCSCLGDLGCWLCAYSVICALWFGYCYCSFVWFV